MKASFSCGNPRKSPLFFHKRGRNLYKKKKKKGADRGGEKKGFDKCIIRLTSKFKDFSFLQMKMNVNNNAFVWGGVDRWSSCLKRFFTYWKGKFPLNYRDVDKGVKKIMGCFLIISSFEFLQPFRSFFFRQKIYEVGLKANITVEKYFYSGQGAADLL